MQDKYFDEDEICSNFCFDGEFLDLHQSNHGHINNTYVIDFQKDGAIKRYILQEINTNVFKNPDQLMENIENVTKYLEGIIAADGGDVLRETLRVHRTVDGKPYYIDSNGRYWRVYNFITDSYTCQCIDCPKTFYNAAKAFGKFQRMLADYPCSTLHETIPNFHNTVSRFKDLKEAVKNDLSGRASLVRDEIEFAFARENEVGVLVDLLQKGELPLRVTHNDTKLNNVMFDNKTGKGICVIDLDTVMPGLSLYDFGDSIRFGANVAADKLNRDIHRDPVPLHQLKEVDMKNLSVEDVLLDLPHKPHFLFAVRHGKEHGMGLPVAGGNNLGDIGCLHFRRN